MTTKLGTPPNSLILKLSIQSVFGCESGVGKPASWEGQITLIALDSISRDAKEYTLAARWAGKRLGKIQLAL